MSKTSVNPLAAEWRSARLLHKLYTALAREFVIDLPACGALDGAEDFPTAESLDAARTWFGGADDIIPVHQLRQFLQTSHVANDETLCATLDHYLHKPSHSDSDRDKTDFLLVQFFSICAPALLEDNEVTLEYVAGILEPFLGTVDLTLPENLSLIEDLIRDAHECHTLQELFASGVLEMAREVKTSKDTNYFLPAAMVVFTRFNFLLRRTFFRRMHQDLNAILDGLRQLEKRGVETLDCRAAQFSSDEPVARLRMICQSWKVMFQAEYSSGQPMKMLVEIRTAVEKALAQSEQGSADAQESAAGPYGEVSPQEAGSEEPSELRAKAAAASAFGEVTPVESASESATDDEVSPSDGPGSVHSFDEQ